MNTPTQNEIQIAILGAATITPTNSPERRANRRKSHQEFIWNTPRRADRTAGTGTTQRNRFGPHPTHFWNQECPENPAKEEQS